MKRLAKRWNKYLSIDTIKNVSLYLSDVTSHIKRQGLNSVKCICAYLSIVHVTYTVTKCAHMRFMESPATIMT